VTSPTSLRFGVGSSPGDRDAWALAHWAVARASGLDVVKVQVSDQVWDRDHSTDGWTKAKKTAPLPNGQVIVSVA
jgi:hypothetical protein